ncbi:hypothetical protein BPNSA17_34880 [Bordetella petrii]
MEHKFIQIAVAPPKPDASFYVLIGLKDDGTVWKARVMSSGDELPEDWVPLVPRKPE